MADGLTPYSGLPIPVLGPFVRVVAKTGGYDKTACTGASHYTLLGLK